MDVTHTIAKRAKSHSFLLPVFQHLIINDLTESHLTVRTHHSVPLQLGGLYSCSFLKIIYFNPLGTDVIISLTMQSLDHDLSTTTKNEETFLQDFQKCLSALKTCFSLPFVVNGLSANSCSGNGTYKISFRYYIHSDV